MKPTNLEVLQKLAQMARQLVNAADSAGCPEGLAIVERKSVDDLADYLVNVVDERT